ncbi:hypothetical protein ACS0TY_011234 [Phlomoides rotata]
MVEYTTTWIRSLKMRVILVDWLIEAHKKFELMKESLSHCGSISAKNVPRRNSSWWASTQWYLPANRKKSGHLLRGSTQPGLPTPRTQRTANPASPRRRTHPTLRPCRCRTHPALNVNGAAPLPPPNPANGEPRHKVHLLRILYCCLQKRS